MLKKIIKFFKQLVLPVIILVSIIYYSLPVKTQQPQFNTAQYRGGFDGEKLTVSNTVKTLSSSVYNPTITNVPSVNSRADYAYITVEGDAIRYWPCTGALCTVGAPTSTSGHLVPVNGSFTVWGFSNIQNLQMIRVTTDATINVSYYRFINNVQ